MISQAPLTVAIKNFMRNKMVNLTAVSVKHFMPNADIHCFTLYKESMDEYKDQEPLCGFITEHVHPTKYVSGKDIHDHVDPSKTSGYANPQNGAFFTEGYNLIFDHFQNLDSKVLMLVEDHFFTTGQTLREAVENDWDVCYATWFRGAERANGSILGIVPSKVGHLFPFPEHGVIEYVIGGHLLARVDPARRHQLTTRDEVDYKGDGLYTNSSVVMEAEMQKAGILL